MGVLYLPKNYRKHVNVYRFHHLLRVAYNWFFCSWHLAREVRKTPLSVSKDDLFLSLNLFGQALENLLKAGFRHFHFGNYLLP